MKLITCLANGLVKFTLGLVAIGLTTCLEAQTPGKAQVRSVKGTASYTAPGAPAAPLKVGTELFSGATVRTGPGSTVDLFLGNSAGFVRITENSTLALDKLAFTETGADTVVEVQLNLPDGVILGNVNKLSAASKYEVKIPSGVAGIRGTRYRISSSAYVVLLDGSLIMVYVQNGQPTPYALFGPPAQTFSPDKGPGAATPDQIELVKKDGTGLPGYPGSTPGPTTTTPPAGSQKTTDLPFVPPSPTEPPPSGGTSN